MFGEVENTKLKKLKNEKFEQINNCQNWNTNSKPNSYFQKAIDSGGFIGEFANLLLPLIYPLIICMYF